MDILYDVAFIFVALLALGITIFVHELGHFLAAKRRGLVIKRFSIGFGPKLFGWEKDGVEYRLSAIPFGGYVALPQLADMGRLEGAEEERRNAGDEKHSENDDENDEDDEEKKEEPLPKISYADKMIVAVMGAVFNVLFAFVLSCVLWFFGYDVRASQLTTTIGYVAEEVGRWNPDTEQHDFVPGPAKEAGLLPGDDIREVDGASVEDFMDVQNRIVTGKQTTEDGRRLVILGIERNGTRRTVNVHPELWTVEQMRVIGISPKETFFIGELSPNMPGEAVGLEPGDQPLSIDGLPIHSFHSLVDHLEALEANATVALTVRKGAETNPEGPLHTYSIKPVRKETEQGGEIVTRTLIGFRPKHEVETTYPNPVILIYKRVKDMYLTLSGLVSPKSDVKLRNMSGPVGIVDHLSVFAKIGFKKLLWFVVFVNVNLAILNLLPIPVLDGGHMLFATVEKLRGRPLPIAFLERTQLVFIALIFSFMLYVTFFDLRRLLP